MGGDLIQAEITPAYNKGIGNPNQKGLKLYFDALVIVEEGIDKKNRSSGGGNRRPAGSLLGIELPDTIEAEIESGDELGDLVL